MNKSIFKQLALAGTLMGNSMQGDFCPKCNQTHGKQGNYQTWCGKCCKACHRRDCGELNNAGHCAACIEAMQLTIDFIMIVGKYFEGSNDFINVMKVCKKYEELVSMYKFNPISDISLFENIQTQHFYKKEDKKN